MERIGFSAQRRIYWHAGGFVARKFFWHAEPQRVWSFASAMQRGRGGKQRAYGLRRSAGTQGCFRFIRPSKSDAP